MRALIKKEIRILFASLIFPIAAALFLFLTGFAFTAAMTQASPSHLPEASIRGIIYFMAVIFLFITPFLTMRSFAEEKKLGTIELLKTSPLSDLQIVLAKYCGVIIPLGLILLLTLEFPLLVTVLGDPDKAPMILAYVGLFLMAASFSAIGLFMSSLTKNQMLAAILSFVTIMTLWFLGDIGGELGKKVSIIEHIHSFSLGIIDSADVAYYLLVTFLFLFLTYRVLKAERWKAILLTGGILLISILLYGILEKRHWRWDLTQNQEYSLSDQTEKILKELNTEVKIVAFFRRGEDLDDVFIRRKVDDILNEYAARSSKIDYKMVDPDTDVETSTQYQINTDGTILFQSEKGRKEIYKSQLFDYQKMSEKALPEFMGENLFTNAVLKITRDKQNTLYFLEGHGERTTSDQSSLGFSVLKQYLEKNNYNVKSLSLMAHSSVPKDGDLLVVASPTYAIPEAEDKIIRNGLRKGKLLMLIEPLAPLPSQTLDFLKIKMKPDLILDPTRHFVLGSHYPVPLLSDHPSTKTSQNTNPIFTTVRSLSFSPDEKDMIPLMTSSPEAWGETDLLGKDPKYTKGKDDLGPLTLGVAIENAKKPLAIIVGDADFASNALIQAPGNLDLILNMIAWLVEDTEQIGIRAQTSEFRNITLTAGRAKFIAYFTQLIYPTFILLVGGAYWFRRRYS